MNSNNLAFSNSYAHNFKLLNITETLLGDDYGQEKKKQHK